jgi:glutamate--cysteine ligase
MAPDSARLRHIVEALFQPGPTARPDGSIGAELELIPVRDGSHRRVGILATDDGPGTAEVFGSAALIQGWREAIDAYGAPSWITQDGGRICYEPGGQIEITSPVFPSVTGLEHYLRDTVTALRSSASEAGISLLTSGVDPYSPIDVVPLELHAPRYDAMTRYFDSIGPSGARMMRQTASLQVSVELGPDPMQRWALLNALAPYLIASYANSPTYEGRPTGYASYRARLWQTLDRTRTGLPFNATDAVGAYVSFAESAGRILDDDEAHVSTLFPEIRPRGYFEIRSMDSMEPDRVGEALRFISSIVYDADVATEAARIIGPPDPTLLEEAATLGRSHPAIGKRLDLLERLAASAGTQHG